MSDKLEGKAKELEGKLEGDADRDGDGGGGDDERDAAAGTWILIDCHGHCSSGPSGPFVHALRVRRSAWMCSRRCGTRANEAIHHP